MPNLVGIGNSQVPTNAMLGGLAYKDSADVEVISKIKARLSISPLSSNHYGIFVYDTKQDSDGGAWRHRTDALAAPHSPQMAPLPDRLPPDEPRPQQVGDQTAES